MPPEMAAHRRRRLCLWLTSNRRPPLLRTKSIKSGLTKYMLSRQELYEAGQVPSNLHFNEWSGLAIGLAVRVEAAVVLPWVSSIANLSQQVKISANAHWHFLASYAFADLLCVANYFFQITKYSYENCWSVYFHLQ